MLLIYGLNFKKNKFMINNEIILQKTKLFCCRINLGCTVFTP